MGKNRCRIVGTDHHVRTPTHLDRLNLHGAGAAPGREQALGFFLIIRKPTTAPVRPVQYSLRETGRIPDHPSQSPPGLLWPA